MPFKWVLWAGLIGALAESQEESTPKPPELALSCDVHVCLLDPDRDPCDPEEIKVDLVFRSDGEDPPVVRALSRGSSSDPVPASLSWSILDLEGTHFKVGVAAFSTYPPPAQTEGERQGRRKEFLSPLSSPVLPVPRKKLEKMDGGAKAVYFQVRLGPKEIRELAELPLSKVYVVLTIRGERKAVQALRVSKGQGSGKS